MAGTQYARIYKCEGFSNKIRTTINTGAGKHYIEHPILFEPGDEHYNAGWPRATHDFTGMSWGPDNNLYVGSYTWVAVFKYNGFNEGAVGVLQRSNKSEAPGSGNMGSNWDSNARVRGADWDGTDIHIAIDQVGTHDRHEIYNGFSSAINTNTTLTPSDDSGATLNDTNTEFYNVRYNLHGASAKIFVFNSPFTNPASSGTIDLPDTGTGNWIDTADAGNDIYVVQQAPDYIVYKIRKSDAAVLGSITFSDDTFYPFSTIYGVTWDGTDLYINVDYDLIKDVPDPNYYDGAIKVTSFDFGSQDLGTNTDKSFTLKNEHPGDLVFDDFTIIGPNADNFSIVSIGSDSNPPFTPHTIQGTEAPDVIFSETVVIRFTPSPPGSSAPGTSKSATLRLTYTDNNGSQIEDLVLSGAAVVEPNPTITGINPTIGSVNGGTSVTITGTNFTGTPGTTFTVEFGGVEATNYSGFSSTSVTCDTPANSAGQVDVVVTNDASQTATELNGFLYVGPPTLTSVTPNYSKLTGGLAPGIAFPAYYSIAGNGFTNRHPLPKVRVYDNTLTLRAEVDRVVDATNSEHRFYAPDVTTWGPGTYTIKVVNPVGSTEEIESVDSLSFTYNPAPTFTSITPNWDVLTGGKTVTIEGTNFIAGTSVDIKFGGLTGISADNVQFVDSTHITCEVPDGTFWPGLGTYAIGIVNGDDATIESPAGVFSYVAAAAITNISPDEGPLVGITVTITGTSLYDVTGVTFGGDPATGLNLTGAPISITCDAPAHTVGSQNVVVYTAAGNASAPGGFTYNAPSINNVTPNEGPTAGGTSVTIDGANLTGVTAVRFKYSAIDEPADAVLVVDDSTVTCETPDVTDSPGLYDVECIVSTYGSGTGVDEFTFYQTTVTNITPNVGSTLGSAYMSPSDITITGSNLTGTSSVTFGADAATGIVVAGDGLSLTCSPPAHTPAGFVNVVVTATAGTSTTTNGFEYRESATLNLTTPATPNYASVDAGKVTTVTISGSDFLGGDIDTIVWIGASRPMDNVSVVNDSTILCDTTGHTGPITETIYVLKIVSDNNGPATPVILLSLPAPSSFVFDYLPEITSVTPDEGSTSGGQSVTIAGDNFINPGDGTKKATLVKFGANNATSLVVGSAISLTCNIPSQATAGIYDVEVQVAGRWPAIAPTYSVTSLSAFTYYLPLEVSILPSYHAGDEDRVAHSNDPVNVDFTIDANAPITSVTWEFQAATNATGDPPPIISVSQTPTDIRYTLPSQDRSGYPVVGYEIQLVAIGPSGADSVTDHISILNPPAPSSVDFTANVTEGLLTVISDFTSSVSGGDAGGLYEYEWRFYGAQGAAGPYLSSSVANPQDIVWDTVGVFKVELLAYSWPGIATGNYTTETKTTYITVYGQIAASFTSTPENATWIANGAPLKFEVDFAAATPPGEVVSYSWDWGTGAPNPPNPPYNASSYNNIQFSPGHHIVILTVVGNGPNNVDSVGYEFDVYTPVTPLFTPSVLNGLPPLSVNFTDASTGDYFTALNQWDFDGDTIVDQIGNLPAPAFVYNTPGSYTVKLLIVGNGGTGFTTAAIDVYEPVTAEFTYAYQGGNQISIATVNFDGSAPTYSTGDVVSYYWEFIGGAPSTSNAAAPSGVVWDTGGVHGEFTVKLTVIGAGGDQDIEQKTALIIVYSPAVASFDISPTSARTGIENLTINPSAFSNNSTGDIDTYSWTFPGGTPNAQSGPDSLPTQSIVYSSPGVYNVQLTVSGDGGVDIHTESNYVTIYIQADAEISVAQDISTVPFSPSLTNNSTGSIALYRWVVAGSNLPSPWDNTVATPPSLTYNSPGNYQITLTTNPSGEHGGTSSDSVILHLYDPVQASFDASATQGVNSLQDVQYTLTATGDYDPALTEWTFEGGSPGSFAGSTPGLVGYSAVGSYDVILKVYGYGGDVSILTETNYIRVWESLSVDFDVVQPTYTTVGVVPFVVGFDNLTTGDHGGSAWSFPVPSTDVPGGVSNDFEPTVTYVTAGAWDVGLIVNGLGPVDLGVAFKPDFITAYDPITAAFSTTFATAGAGSVTLTFQNDSTGGNDIGVGAPNTYLWECPGSTLPGEISTDFEPTVTWNQPGTYNVRLTASGPANNTDTTGLISGYVVVHEASTSLFSLAPASGPEPLEVDFTNLSTGAISIYTWNFTGGTPSSFVGATPPNVVYSTAGTYIVTLEVNGPGGYDLSSDLLTVYAAAQALFTTDVIPPEGRGSTIINFDGTLSSGDYDTYYWVFEGAGPVIPPATRPSSLTSSLPSPAITYEYGGFWDVSLTVSGDGGSDNLTINQLVKTYTVAVADFSANPVVGFAPQSVTFANASSGEISLYTWSFPGGTPTTFVGYGPVVVDYTIPGLYTVTLDASGLGGDDTEVKGQYVEIWVPLEADFVADATEGIQSFEVTFNNLSTGDYEGAVWHFGRGPNDLLTIDDPANPITYGVGTYTVKLTITGHGATDIETKTGYITVYERSVANFLATPTEGFDSVQVQFTSTSTGDIATHSWTLPGGDPSSTSILNPFIDYNTPGSYDVTLDVDGPGGPDTITVNNYIKVWETIVPDFTASALEGVGSLGVQFTNTTTGDYEASQTYWHFGRGGGDTSTELNPVATIQYNTPGTYDITLKMGGHGLIVTEVKPGFIKVYHEMVADFTAPPTSTAPSIIQPVNNSTDEDDASTSWTFPGGAPATSSLRTPPPITYATPGVYTIGLTVIGLGVANTSYTERQITVYTPAVADFSGSPVVGVYDMAVNFQNLSTGDFNSAVWDFGDGQVYAGPLLEPPAPIVYTTRGIYDVTLTVSGLADPDTEIKYNYVMVYQPVVAEFTAIPDPPEAISSLTVDFTNESTGDHDTYLWTFPGGNPASSTLLDPPPIVYSSTGHFNVTLQASGPGGSQTLTKPAFVKIFVPVIADFTASSTAGAGSLNVQFYNASTGDYDIANTYWQFGTGDTSTDFEPNYLYAVPGVYTVKLSMSGDGGIYTQEKVGYVEVYEPADADFEPSTTFTSIGTAVVDFINTTTGAFDPAQVLWTFEGGVPYISTDLDPVQIHYAAPGEYDVTLEVNGNGGYSIEHRPDHIVVYTPAVANFIPTVPVIAIGPTVVLYTDISTGDIDTWEWTFDGGTPSSYVGASFSENPPPISYNAPGVYDVILRVSGDGGVGIQTLPNYVTIYGPAYAEFEAVPQRGFHIFTTEFNNLSTGSVDTYAWTFEGGTPSTSSLADPPLITYTAKGLYDVILTVSGDGGTDVSYLTNYVEVYDPIIPTFSSTSPTGVGSLNVDFFNTSTGDYEGAIWDFGNGQIIYDVHPPSLIAYDTPGTYSVKLVMTGHGAIVTVEAINYITVYEIPVADFTYAPAAGTTTLNVDFVNQSVGDIETYAWVFEGGSPATYNDIDPPQVFYGTPGVYDVSLIITGYGWVSQHSVPNAITVYEPVIAAFHLSLSERQGIGSVQCHFANNSVGDFNHSFTLWEFGDGSTSSEFQPIKLYSSYGPKTVTLTMKGPGGIDSHTEANYIVVYEPASAGFVADITEGFSPLSVNFTNQSTGEIDTYAWDFGNGDTSIAQNPPTIVYDPTDETIYSVTLNVDGDGGFDNFYQPAYIRVYQPLVATFTNTAPTVGIDSVTVTFFTYNEGLGSYEDVNWVFPGGTPSTYNSTGPIEVEFTAPGSHDITFTVSGHGESTFVTVQDLVIVYEHVTADFSANFVRGRIPFSVDFQNDTTGDADTYSWTLPGGTPSSSTALEPNVIYQLPGRYTVTLESSGNGGTDSITKVNYILTYEVHEESFDGKIYIYSTWENPFDGEVYAYSTTTVLVDGHIYVKFETQTDFIAEAYIYSIDEVLIIGHAYVYMTGDHNFNGAIYAHGVDTPTFNAHIHHNATHTTYFNGTVRYFNTAEDQIYGHVHVAEVDTNEIYGVVDIHGVDAPTFDGQVFTWSHTTAVINGSIHVSIPEEITFDGELALYGVATPLINGQIRVREVAEIQASGRLYIRKHTITTIHARLYVRYHSATSFGGRVFVFGSPTDLIIGRVHVVEVAQAYIWAALEVDAKRQFSGWLRVGGAQQVVTCAGSLRIRQSEVFLEEFTLTIVSTNDLEETVPRREELNTQLGILEK